MEKLFVIMAFLGSFTAGIFFCIIVELLCVLTALIKKGK